MKLVIFPAVEPARLAAIVEAAGPMRVVNAPDAAAARAEMPEADAFFGKLTPDLLAAAGRLRWVQSPTASLEHYLFPALVEHPCVLTNMRGIFSDVIAEQVFGYLLAFVRRLHVYLREQAAARWAPLGGEAARQAFAEGPGVESAIDRAHGRLAGQTLGIVGLGGIGREVARRAVAFEMRVVAVDPAPADVPAGVEWVRPLAGLDGLLAESDFVVIAAPHTPETERLFDAARLARMRPTAFLVNVGRGAIVDLAALVEALDAGRLAGAALDVFETEPLPAEHPLWRQPNVILTPHVAGFAPVVPERHRALLLDNVRRFASGLPLRNVVDKRRWY